MLGYWGNARLVGGKSQGLAVRQARVRPTRLVLNLDLTSGALPGEITDGVKWRHSLYRSACVAAVCVPSAILSV